MRELTPLLIGAPSGAYPNDGDADRSRLLLDKAISRDCQRGESGRSLRLRLSYLANVANRCGVQSAAYWERVASGQTRQPASVRSLQRAAVTAATIQRANRTSPHGLQLSDRHADIEDDRRRYVTSTCHCVIDPHR